MPFMAFAAVAQAQQTDIVIDPRTTYQTITDFGASDCWTADYIGKYFTESTRSYAARRMFSQKMGADGSPEGIGLSCWRVNIGAGSATQGADSNIEDETRRTECFLNADGTYDWTRQAGQQYFMKQALDYGVDHFVLFSNSAPVYYTKNGLANTGNVKTTCNVSAGRFADFAEFLATTAEHFVSEGYNVTRISPVNEPQFDWYDGQEGSPWRNTDIAVLARELDKSLTARNLDTKILLPEASSLDMLYGGTGYASNHITAFFNDAYSTYIGNLPSLAREVAGHSYWTFGTNADLRNVREKVRDAAAKYGIDVVQSEWSMLDAEPQTETGFPASYDEATYMDIALFMGKLIHCDLAFGNMSSWSYWTAFACERYSQKNRFYLMRIRPKSGDYGSLKEGGSVMDNQNLWVLGNYSFFIRPGYKRVSLSGADDMNGLLGSAYMAPDGSRIVAVFVNMGNDGCTVSVGVDGLAEGTEVTSVEKFVTDKRTTLKRATPDESIGTVSLTARSVTTVVLNLGTDSAVKGITASDGADAASALNGAVYTLDGRKVDDAARMHRGVYIRDGKKLFCP